MIVKSLYFMYAWKEEKTIFIHIWWRVEWVFDYVPGKFHINKAFNKLYKAFPQDLDDQDDISNISWTQDIT